MNPQQRAAALRLADALPLYGYGDECEAIMDEAAALLRELAAEPVQDDRRSEAYDKIDRHLRNTLDDSDYADFSAALDVVYAQPAQGCEDSEQRACVRQALPEAWRDSVPSVAVATLTAERQLLRQQMDALGVAIADAGYTWTPEMRAAYELAAEPACACGEPNTAGVVHRTDGPCYIAEPAQEPQAEPVAWVYESKPFGKIMHWERDTPKFAADLDAATRWPDVHSLTPLYAHPPQQRRPLSDKQLHEFIINYSGYGGDDIAAVVRAIERAHGIGEEP